MKDEYSDWYLRKDNRIKYVPKEYKGVYVHVHDIVHRLLRRNLINNNRRFFWWSVDEHIDNYNNTEKVKVYHDNNLDVYHEVMENIFSTSDFFIMLRRLRKWYMLCPQYFDTEKGFHSYYEIVKECMQVLNLE